MRQILTDCARARGALKRGAGAVDVPISADLEIVGDTPHELVVVISEAQVLKRPVEHADTLEQFGLALQGQGRSREASSSQERIERLRSEA